MYEILKELLEDFKRSQHTYYETYVNINDKRIIALESVIEVLEKLRSETNE